MEASESKLEVVVGVLTDALGRVLVQQRPPGRARAGAWEFPGGKREEGEIARDALVRELAEELGIEVKVASRLIVLTHRYADASRPVRLDCWRVTGWTNEPRGLDGQIIRWCPPAALGSLALLEADWPLATALVLPAIFVHEPERERLEERLRRRAGARTQPVAWITSGSAAAAVGATLGGSPDRLCVVDPPAPAAAGLIPLYTLARHDARTLPADGLWGALVDSAEEARLARHARASFLLVKSAGLAPETLEAIGEVGLPYYPNVAHGTGRAGPGRAPLAPVPVPTGQLWWKGA